MVRKQRIRDRAAFLAATSSLPARMARHAAMQDVAEERAKSAVGRADGTLKSGFANSGEDDNVGEEGGIAEETGLLEPQDIIKVMQRRQERQVPQHHYS